MSPLSWGCRDRRPPLHPRRTAPATEAAFLLSSALASACTTYGYLPGPAMVQRLASGRDLSRCTRRKKRRHGPGPMSMNKFRGAGSRQVAKAGLRIRALVSQGLGLTRPTSHRA
eukprot:359978-Chlamydomonas_euryale.AAC.2